MKKLIYLLVLFALFSFLAALQVKDTGEIIKLKSGEKHTRHITIYNFADIVEQVTVDIDLTQYPTPKIDSFQLDLVTVQHKQVKIEPSKKILLPVNIKVHKWLAKGRYVVWLRFRQLAKEEEADGLVIKEYQRFNIPLVIDVN